MSEALREIAEYVSLYAKKHHITEQEALKHAAVVLFKDYKEQENENINFTEENSIKS